VSIHDHVQTSVRGRRSASARPATWA